MNIETGKLTRIAPPEKYASAAGFVEPYLLKKTNELLVSQMTTASIHVFDAGNLEYKTTIKTSGNWSKVIEYNESRDELYLTNWVSKNISVIDAETRKEKKTLSCFNGTPRGIVFSDDGAYAYVAVFDVLGKSIGQVYKIELETGKLLKKIGTYGAKRHIVKCEKRGLLYVSDMYRSIIEIISLDTDSVIKTIPVSAQPNTIALSPTGCTLYISCRGPNHPEAGYMHKGLEFGKLHVVDTRTYKTIDIITGGNQPTGLALSSDGRTIAFSDFLDNRIRLYIIEK